MPRYTPVTPAETKLLLEYLKPYYNSTHRRLGMTWLVSGKKGKAILSLKEKGFIYNDAGWFLTDKGQKWLDRWIEAQE